MLINSDLIEHTHYFLCILPTKSYKQIPKNLFVELITNQLLIKLITNQLFMIVAIVKLARDNDLNLDETTEKFDFKMMLYVRLFKFIASTLRI